MELEFCPEDEINFVGGNKMTKGESVDMKKEDEDKTMRNAYIQWLWGEGGCRKMQRSQNMQQHGSQRTGLPEEGNDQRRHILLRG